MVRLSFWTLFAGALLLLALVALAFSRLSFAPVRAYLDGQAGDGRVETYDAAFHERVLRNLRLLAGAFAAGGVFLFAARRRASSTPVAPSGSLIAFRTDLQRVIGDVFKRSSSTHLRFVLLIILVGAALRFAELFKPITYDEAFTYVQYACRPYHILLADYSYPNNHLLHTALVRLSTGLFGTSLWSLRLPALMAGILVMPLFYLFTRTMFNRYIALLALAFVAGSGCLIEYSALARGYSLTWFFYILALVLGRHFLKTNNMVSAFLVALSCALGMWAVPTMVYAAISVYVWLGIHLMAKYRHSVGKRMVMLVASGVMMLVLTILFYVPVITVHGYAQLFHHPTMGDNSWASFVATHQDRTFDLWAYFIDTASLWIALAGIGGLVYAAYISSKYRALLFAVVVGAVPLTIIQCMVGPPRVWTYTLFVLHLGTAIAVFYLLKLLQEKVWTGLSKRMRTAVASLVILAGMGYLGMSGIKDRMERFPEAGLAADWFSGTLRQGDRILVEFPWEAPVEFEFVVRGIGREPLFQGRAPVNALYVLVGPGDGQTPEGVLIHHRHEGVPAGALEKVQDWRRLEVFQARR